MLYLELGGNLALHKKVCITLSNPLPLLLGDRFVYLKVVLFLRTVVYLMHGMPCVAITSILSIYVNKNSIFGFTKLD
jgi:hypothetical protein